ncbi:MAG: hypothetical protein KC413_19715, partial [Anaerolineales bacterium]|nr:hypothetical protein [Anaerolineales bacterium]
FHKARLYPQSGTTKLRRPRLFSGRGFSLLSTRYPMNVPTHFVKRPDKKTLVFEKTKTSITFSLLLALFFHFTMLKVAFGDYNLKEINIQIITSSFGTLLYTTITTIFCSAIELLFLLQFIRGSKYIFDKRERILLKNRKKIADFDNIRQVRIKQGRQRTSYNLLVDLKNGRKVIIYTDDYYPELNNIAKITAKFINVPIRREILDFSLLDLLKFWKK